MARIELDHIRHAYTPNPRSDADYALKEVHHSFDDGGAYALLGPSGCGKTTLLNIISGLLHPSHGSLRFNGRDVTRLSTQERNIAQVFQFPVVYDTMSVYDNLAFPLRNRGVAEADVDRKVRETLDMIGLADRAHRKARGLTADQKQKISLGRALVRSDVNAILFDEPLTVIDPHMKWVLRSQLKQLHRRFGFTMVYVTHDQIEAMSLADRIAVMNKGVLQQFGTPEEVYNAPANTFVANFMGSPSMNLIPATIGEEGQLSLSFGEAGSLPVVSDSPLSERLRTARSSSVIFGVRPEDVELGHADDPRPGLRLPATFVEPIGPRTTVHLGLGGVAMKAVAAKRFRATLGDMLKVVIPEGKSHLFDPASGMALKTGGRHVHA
ncbi:ABC transporter ATP-binding protein [Rhizobiaceae sp. 2RAB30]